MSAVIDNVERRDSGSAHQDATVGKSYAERMRDAEDLLKADFIDAVHCLRAEALVGFAKVYDSALKFTRPATVVEAMVEATDSGRDTGKQVMEIVQRMAKRGDADALAIVDLMATAFANAHAEVDE